MSYKQHNSPFNLTAGSVYSSPKKATFGDEAATLGKKTLDFATEMENALGTTSTEDLTNADEEIATNATDGALANTGEVSEWAQDYKIYGKMTTRSGDLARKSNDESLPPRIRAGAKRKLANQQSREKLQEERNFGEGGRNERHAEKLRIKEEKKLLKIKERNSNRRDKVQDKTDEWDGPIYDPDSNRRSNSPFMMKKQNNMTTQINSRGSAFPMVNPDMDDPTAIPPNRAGGAIKSDVLEQGTTITDPGLKPASQVPINNTFSDLSSSVGEVNQSMNPMAPGQDNTQDQIAQAQENLGTDAATNTPPNIMGGAGMGMHGPAKKDWIQDVNKDIEKRGTKGVCTGSKFGSDSCPPGSKRYNLAETFKGMNKK